MKRQIYRYIIPVAKKNMYIITTKPTNQPGSESTVGKILEDQKKKKKEKNYDSTHDNVDSYMPTFLNYL